MTKMQNKLQDRIIPLIVTGILHGGILLALMLHWQPEPKPFKAKTPRYVSAKLVKMKAQSMGGKLKPATKPKPVTKPVVKPTPQVKPKPVVAPKPDLEAIKKAEEKAKKEADLKAKKKDADLKAKKKDADLKAKKKAADLKAKKAADLKAKKKAADLKAKKKAADEKAKKALLAAAALADEESYEQSSSDQELAASFMGVIQQRVESNWSRPPSARNDMEVLLTITLVPTGDVVSVEVERSSGSSAFDQSAVRAVRKAEQFAELQELPSRVFEQQYRKFHLLFKPEDLRL